MGSDRDTCDIGTATINLDCHKGPHLDCMWPKSCYGMMFLTTGSKMPSAVSTDPFLDGIFVFVERPISTEGSKFGWQICILLSYM